MKILIIEDDVDTQEFLEERLKEKCFAIDIASNGDSGMRKIRDNHYDMILVDYALPQKNGFAIIQEVRALADEQKRSTPIIMISVTNEVTNKVAALEYGADDYLPKPFFFAELMARIQTILRRPRIQETTVFNLGNLMLDTIKQQVTSHGKTIDLTRKEFALLEYLMRHQGTLVTRGAISEHVWNMDLDPFSNTIEMHMVNLRRKIDPSQQYIHNIMGRGYRMEIVKPS